MRDNSIAVDNDFESTLKTGDLLLCDNLSHGFFGYLSWIIKFFTYSDFSHIAMVIKDPTFIHPSLTGLYVWESGEESVPDVEDNKKKFGVQIISYKNFIKKYPGKIYVRKILCQSDEQYQSIFCNKDILTHIHEIVYNKPYDVIISDWIDSYLQIDPSPQKTSRFWCSALVGFFYTKFGLLDKNTDWSILQPRFFSSENKSLKLLNNITLHKEHQIV